jgi:hypothetical protein
MGRSLGLCAALATGMLVAAAARTAIAQTERESQEFVK